MIKLPVPFSPNILFSHFLRTALTLALLLNLCGCSPTRELKHNEEVLKWENDIRAFEQRDANEPDPANAILFAGSSSIRLWDTIKEDMLPFNVIQRGYGGAKFSDFAFYCRRIIYPHQFRALVLFIANDITGEKDDKRPEEVLKLFQYVVRQVRHKYAKEPIFFIAITPTNSRWGVWIKASEVNNLISDYCSREQNLYFIKTETEFIGTDGRPDSTLFIEDQLHLNEKGYKIWTAVIKRNLEILNKP